jgi:hypothetical protein
MANTRFAEFMTWIESGNYRSAVAGIMGQNSVGIERTRALLQFFNRLDVSRQKSLLDWCETPMSPLRISDFDQSWHVEQLARHEMAHIVVAKALGFRTGDVTLVLKSPGGDHVGTSRVFLEKETSSMEQILGYLRSRIAILLAGSIAEVESIRELRSRAQGQVRSEGAASDLQKALELITVLLNVQCKFGTKALEREVEQLTSWAVQVLTPNYDVIQALAKRFADKIEFYGQQIGWAASEIDTQPEIVKIVRFADTTN